MRTRWCCLLLLASMVTGAACSSNDPPLTRPAPPPPPPGLAEDVRPPEPPRRAEAPPAAPLVPPAPVLEDSIASKSIDDLNREAVLSPAFFAYDSSDLTPDGQRVLNANAELLRQYMTWTVTIEGHADERGTAEYNLALGERRAMAARAYLVSLEISSTRLRTVTYGKEFPFDPGHDEAAWAKNRRAHFVITAK